MSKEKETTEKVEETKTEASAEPKAEVKKEKAETPKQKANKETQTPKKAAAAELEIPEGAIASVADFHEGRFYHARNRKTNVLYVGRLVETTNGAVKLDLMEKGSFTKAGTFKFANYVFYECSREHAHDLSKQM